MSGICSIECLPQLMVIDQRHGWNAACSLGAISVLYGILMAGLAIWAGRVRTFLGRREMSLRERRIGYMLLSPTMILGGLGSIHRDMGWMVIGYGLAAAAAIGWPLWCRRNRAPRLP